MKKTLGDYIIILITVIGSVASIFGFGTFFYRQLQDETKYAILALCIVTIYLLSYNIYLISKYRKKTRYAYCFEDFNRAFSYIHSIERLSEITRQELYNRFFFALSAISNAFSTINGHHCGVCLKILVEKNGKPKVYTFCRDEKSTRKRIVGTRDKTDHWLAGNSDFNFIYEELNSLNYRKCFYFSNFLPWKNKYTNTRLMNWPPNGSRLKVFFLRNFRWPLPYRSTIVVPLIPLALSDQSQESLRGFLCIDSPKNIAFYKQFDVEIFMGLADGFYNKIDKLYNLIKDEQ